MRSQPGERARSASALLRVGTAFWSEGLQATCYVTAIDDGEVEFQTGPDAEVPLRTAVPFDLVARHVTSGRWRLLEGERAEEGRRQVRRNSPEIELARSDR